MSFNTDKCEVLQITLNPVILNSYTLHGRHLKGVTEAKYLGVIVERKLSFTKHIIIDIVCKKANLLWHFLAKP